MKKFIVPVLAWVGSFALLKYVEANYVEIFKLTTYAFYGFTMQSLIMAYERLSRA